MKMKNRIFFAAVFVLLISVNAIFAQRNPGKILTTEKIPEISIEAVRGRIPKGCPKEAQPYIIKRDASTGVSRSENLNNFFSEFSKEVQARFPNRGYGEKGPDRFFGDSFPLGNCKICAATLTAEVENEGADNDSLTLWLSDPTLHLVTTGSGGIVGNRFLYLTSYCCGVGAVQPGKPGLWESPSTSSPKTFTLDLNMNGDISSSTSPQNGIDKINQYIFSNPNPALDVIVADDTKVNSMQLVIWR
jgi:hypothetical protein